MTERQSRAPIIEALKKFGELSPTYFCIPSHHRGRGADKCFTDLMGSGFLEYDLTETPITDDLHNAEGAIKEAEELAAELFGAGRTFFLVNGTTCANEAMIISSVSEGDKLLVARNCHKSVLMGLIISGATPIYIEPEPSEAFGSFGSVSPRAVQAAFEKNPDIRAFILTSPTYYGVSSNLSRIAEICHSYGALLLVDEAHGAHFAFSDRLPKSAMASGADMAGQSIHKTLGSMTQSSMLHVRRGFPDAGKVDKALKIVQSTSPSYVLMASLDGARRSMALNGASAIGNMLETAEYLRSELNSIDNVYCPAEDKNVFAVDLTRIVFSVTGIGGFELADTLFNKYAICTEMADSRSVVAVIGHADGKKEADRLISAVRKEAERAGGNSIPKTPHTAVPPMALTPRKAFFSKTEVVDLDSYVGKICAEMIAPYPPGIPVIYPGEVMTEEIYGFIAEAVKEKRHIHGFSDKTMRTLKIIKEEK